ncbi:MAG: 16S rRNA (cytosine(967)-C(5))-methyltransferase RsmB [Eubacterium sp.]
MKNPRLVAFEVLYGIQQNNAYSNLSLDKALYQVEARDKALVSAVVYGTIERRITLEYIVKQFLDGKTKPKVKLLLLMATYQLYFMDKIPSSAAINETVELAKNVGVSYYSKFINAILRKIDKNRIEIDNLDDLSVKYSCPIHLIKMWQKAYGEENTDNILKCINNKAPVFAIPNRNIVDEEELSYELLSNNIDNEIYNDVVKITSSFDLHNCKPFEDGLFYIEDYSSYQCAKKLNAKPGDTVIDVCAAPGGKSFTITNSMNNQGRVIACDLHRHKVDLISKSCKRLQISIIESMVNDATLYNPNMPMADKVLCDVPCSGFGIIRRKPEIRYKDLDSIKDLPAIQLSILATSARYLKPGGTLVYSTCTLNKRENESVVSAFLEAYNDFELIEQKTIFPSIDGGDGFFLAVIKRND